MTLSERIRHLVEYSKMSIPKFADFVGFKTPQTVRELIKGNTKTVSEPVQYKIIQAFPEINLDWLLTGEGPMLKGEFRDEVEDITREEAEQIAKGLRTGELTVIPLIPASAFAGSVKGFVPESIELSRCEKITSPIAGAELAIPITGDSMEPDYPNGSIAYIKRINETAFIPWGHTVILDTENGAFIKRIYPDDANEEYVWGKSINPAYPPMHIPKSSIFHIFRVLGTARIFTTM